MAKVLRRALAAALCLVGTAPALADPDSEELVRAWVRSVDAHPDWSATAAGISSQGADTLIEGLAITRAGPDVTLSLGRVRLRDLAPRGGGGFSASEIEASAMAAAFGEVDATVPAAAARSVSLPALPAVPSDAGALLTYAAAIYSALAEAEIGELAAPEMTVVQPLPAEEAADAGVATATYRGLRIGELRSGVLQGGEVGPVTFSSGTQGAGSRSEIARVDFERVDFRAIAHVLDEANYSRGQGDGIWRPALARLRYSGISVSGPDGTTVRLDEVSAETLDARQPPRPFASRLEDLAATPAETPAESEVAFGTISDLLAAFRVGTVQMRGLSAASIGLQPASASLADMTVRGWSAEGIETFDLADLRFDSPFGSGALASMQFAGLVFPNYAAFLDLMGLDDETADPAAKDAAIRTALYGLPRLNRFALTGLSAGQTPTSQVSLKSLALDLDRYVGPFPAMAKLSLESLRVPGELLRLDPQSAELFDGLGLSELILDLSAGETWDEPAGRVDATFGISIANAGDLDLSYTYAGVTEDWVVSAIAAAAASPGESDTEAMLKVLDGLGLESATVRATDRSLLDRAFGYAAAKQNLTIAGPAYREQMRGALPFMLSMAISADLQKLLIAPLQSFLAGGQTLVVEARPAAAIPLPALSEAIEKDPMSVPGLLNLTIRSEPAAPRP